MRYRVKVEVYDEGENRVWCDWSDYLVVGSPLPVWSQAMSKLWDRAWVEIWNRLT
jgi:hypothetical protein